MGEVGKGWSADPVEGIRVVGDMEAGGAYSGGYAAVNTSEPLSQSAPLVDVGE